MRIVFCFLLLVLLSALPGVAQTPAADSGGTCVGGKPNSPIKLEVFSDYQCPACRDFYLGTMRSVLAEYADPGKVCVVYREFPLSIHRYAPQAARYAHAALRLGLRQWAMVTEALYLSQAQWSQDGQLEPVIARALSPEDMARLRKESADPAMDAAISNDIALGRQRDVTSTPTFFITAKGKTEKNVGVVQYPILRRYLDSLLGQ